MPVDARHPLFDEMYEEWMMMRDTFAGERKVKQCVEYLPPSEGMIEDGLDGGNYSTAATYNNWAFWTNRQGSPGARRYFRYRNRAVFYDFVAEAVKACLGAMWHKPPIIELPAVLEPLRLAATLNGESLEQLLRSINEQQLVAGRVGILLDLPTKPDITNPLPYMVLYHAEKVFNWDDGIRDDPSRPRLNLVVLDESAPERKSSLEWEHAEKFRVLVLGDLEQNEDPGEAGTYKFTLVRGKIEVDPATLEEPSLRGVTLDEIPFKFVNCNNTNTPPEEPPLAGLARLALAIYRGDADYRLSLYQQSMATIVRIGVGDENAACRVGADVTIDVPQGGDAKYIVAPPEGLNAQREALNDDKMLAAQRALTLIDTRSGQKEGAETLRIRSTAQTASLTQIAMVGASGLESMLKMAARWVGADENEVKVTPNLDFAGMPMLPDDLLKLVTAKNMGAPLSWKSIHELQQQGELTNLEYETELEEIEGEPPPVMAMAPVVADEEETEADNG